MFFRCTLVLSPAIPSYCVETDQCQSLLTCDDTSHFVMKEEKLHLHINLLHDLKVSNMIIEHHLLQTPILQAGATITSILNQKSIPITDVESFHTRHH